MKLSMLRFSTEKSLWYLAGYFGIPGKYCFIIYRHHSADLNLANASDT